MSSVFYLGLFLMSILIASYSQILLKKGALEKNIYINKYTIVGYTLMVVSTLFTLVGYKGISLSLSQMLQALSFITVAIFSYIFLKEKVTKRMIIGTILICIGIIIYAL